jgi:FkbM family methyltransferase
VLSKLLGTPSYAERASALSRKIRGEQGTTTACDAIGAAPTRQPARHARCFRRAQRPGGVAPRSNAGSMLLGADRVLPGLSRAESYLMNNAYSQASGMVRRFWRRILPDPDAFLHKVSGVIHVGANSGQERGVYDQLGLRVLWVEPIPEVFAALSANIAPFHRQKALQCLVTDKDDAEYQFHVASNEGASSSILEFGLHPDIWPEIRYQKSITLRSRTLPSLLKDAQVDVSEYDALILDTQGSELLILRGAEAILRSFAYIKVEVADFESYVGGAQVPDVARYLKSHGFKESRRREFAHRRDSSYYDIVYRRL